MEDSPKIGAELLAAFLKKQGVDHVFGIPGSEDLDLYEALDRGNIRIVLAAHELGAGFMAIGWGRARRSPGVLLVIAGPGFTNSLTVLAEAYFDAAPLICLLVKRPAIEDRRFQFQRIDERALAKQFLKRVVTVEQAAHLPIRMEEAFRAAVYDGPGPVLVEIAHPVLTQKAESYVKPSRPDSKTVSEPNVGNIEEIQKRIGYARKPVLFLGRRAESAADRIPEFVERLGGPVLVTPGARGLLPENHVLYMGGDFARTDVADVNSLLEESDLVLALGCRFTQACTAGYRLKIPLDRLIVIESELSSEVDDRAALRIPVTVNRFIQVIQNSDIPSDGTAKWKPKELKEWRDRLLTIPKHRFLEPGLQGLRPAAARSFFRILRDEMPDSFRLVTDCGLHQLLARRWHEARAPGSFLFPHEYQSMGYGLPVSIGAVLAEPERPTLTVAGDGGFVMTGMELGTAVREGLSLAVTVFNDHHLGIIRMGQIKRWGRSFATRTSPFDFAGFARAAGAEYHRLDHNLTEILARCREGGVHLIEVIVRDNLNIYRARIKGKLKARLKH